MTENEAFKSIIEDGIELGAGDYVEFEALKVAAKALEEIQKYRVIGTVEECQEARERQRAKKPVNLEYVRDDYSWTGECPHCRAYVSENTRYCLICGQKLDWRKP